MVKRSAKLFTYSTAVITLAATVFLAPGCKGDKDAKAKHPAAPAKNAKTPENIPAPPTDYFPLKLNFSWKYYLWNCLACPRTSVDVVITGIKQIGGKQVYLINSGASGYFEDGGSVYLALINKGKLINMGVAGKHNLKPGDSWEIELDSKGKVTTKDEGTTPSGKKKRSWKYELKTQGAKKQSVCGRPQMMGFPSDEPTRQAYFNTICCRVVSNKNGENKTEHASCYADGVGLVAEYFTDAKSEIASFSAAAQPVKPSPPKKK